MLLPDAACRAFISGLLGDPEIVEADGVCWLSPSPHMSHGKPVIGWWVGLCSHVVSLEWADLTPPEEVLKLLAIIGWSLVNGFGVSHPTVVIRAQVGATGCAGNQGPRT